MIKIDTTPKMWVYHEKECKEGKIIDVEDRDLYLSDDWVESPNDFDNRPVRGRKPKKLLNGDVSHETESQEDKKNKEE